MSQSAARTQTKAAGQPVAAGSSPGPRFPAVLGNLELDGTEAATHLAPVQVSGKQSHPAPTDGAEAAASGADRRPPASRKPAWPTGLAAPTLPVGTNSTDLGTPAAGAGSLAALVLALPLPAGSSEEPTPGMPAAPLKSTQTGLAAELPAAAGAPAPPLAPPAPGAELLTPPTITRTDGGQPARDAAGAQDSADVAAAGTPAPAPPLPGPRGEQDNPGAPVSAHTGSVAAESIGFLGQSAPPLESSVVAAARSSEPAAEVATVVSSPALPFTEASRPVAAAPVPDPVPQTTQRPVADPGSGISTELSWQTRRRAAGAAGMTSQARPMATSLTSPMAGTQPWTSPAEPAPAEADSPDRGANPIATPVPSGTSVRADAGVPATVVFSGAAVVNPSATPAPLNPQPSGAPASSSGPMVSAAPVTPWIPPTSEATQESPPDGLSASAESALSGRSRRPARVSASHGDTPSQAAEARWVPPTPEAARTEPESRYTSRQQTPPSAPYPQPASVPADMGGAAPSAAAEVSQLLAEPETARATPQSGLAPRRQAQASALRAQPAGVLAANRSQGASTTGLGLGGAPLPVAAPATLETRFADSRHMAAKEDAAAPPAPARSAASEHQPPNGQPLNREAARLAGRRSGDAADLEAPSETQLQAPPTSLSGSLATPPVALPPSGAPPVSTAPGVETLARSRDRGFAAYAPEGIAPRVSSDAQRMVAAAYAAGAVSSTAGAQSRSSPIVFEARLTPELETPPDGAQTAAGRETAAGIVPPPAHLDTGAAGADLRHGAAGDLSLPARSAREADSGLPPTGERQGPATDGAKADAAPHSDAGRKPAAVSLPASSATTPDVPSAAGVGGMATGSPAAGDLRPAPAAPRDTGTPLHTADTRPAPETVKPPAVARDMQFAIGGGDQRVELRVAERAGELHVTVRSPDQRLAGSLRGELPALTARLESAGLRTETWHADFAGRQRLVDPPSRTLSQNSQEQPEGDGRRQQDDPPPRRPKQSEDSDSAHPKTDRKDFQWLFTSLR